MAKVVIDGVEYEVNPDNNLLQEALSKGLDLPYFCWHPCMGSVGACRQCAVKQYRDSEDTKGSIVMACMTPATDGTMISIDDEQAKDMRERVIESLMISHPHDCPVCEEGGECHLQDMTLMSGHNYRRYDKKKVTHRNQYLGPFINHEMNRCITCYRCVRFYDDYAGGTDLAAQASHHHTYFGRYEEGVLESEFSGNLVEVCPTGVFTDKAFSEHYSRKWDLQTAPSICAGCGTGCNITPGERYGTLRRVVNRYNAEVNGYFICDRGRFGFDYVNSAERIRSPENIDITQELEKFRDGGAIGIGSPRASMESNFALREFVGESNFYSGLSDIDNEAIQLTLSLGQDSSFRSPSIKEIEAADAVIIIGEDVTNTSPRLALALRQSVRNHATELAKQAQIPAWQDAAVRELAQHERSPLILLTPYATRLDDVASDILVGPPSELVEVAGVIASAISENAPKTDGKRDGATQIADALLNAKRPLVVAGASAGKIEYIQTAANIARALSEKRKETVDLCLTTPEVNSLGMAMLTNKENSLGIALNQIIQGDARNVIVLENDLYRRAPHSEVAKALEKTESLMVIDQLPTKTTEQASLLLPATAFSEHEATYVNYEGRAQVSFQVHQNKIGARPAWRWLSENPKESISSLSERLQQSSEAFKGIAELRPEISGTVSGMQVPRQSHRYSGRTAMRANVNVHEPKQPVDSESVLSFSMEGIPAAKDATILSAPWSPSWNSNQSITKFQEEVSGDLKQGNTGKVLLNRDKSGSYLEIKVDTSSSKDGLELALAHQIFGSGELSAKSVAIQKRMVDPYIGLSKEDADSLGLKQGDSVSLDGNGNIAAVVIRNKIKTGTAALYCGENEIDYHSLGSSVVLTKAENTFKRGIENLIVSDLYEEGY